MMRGPHVRSVCTGLFMFTVLVLFLRRTYLDWPRGYTLLDTPEQWQSVPDDTLYGMRCSPFHAGLMKDVTIVLKVGAGEVSKKLPAFLKNFTICNPTLRIFSDRKDVCMGYDVEDALANLPSDYWGNNPDFEVYDAIQHADFHTEETHTTDGWRLDKYKFLPMMEHIWQAATRSDWYVFIELDTYVDWDNMQRFLASFDPQRPHFLGAPVWPVRLPPFAHGGTGYVLSIGALQKLMDRGTKLGLSDTRKPGTHQFGMELRERCCGDEILTDVLRDSGVRLRGYAPMFNGETPNTIRFGWETWCEAILTMHHMHADDFARFEEWKKSSRDKPWVPLTFEELFKSIETRLQDRVEDWDNLSENVIIVGRKEGKSFETCAEACARDRKCMQFEHSDDTCQLGYFIRLGQRQDSKAGKTWTSGWMRDRIQEFKAQHSPCDGPHFVYSNP